MILKLPTATKMAAAVTISTTAGATPGTYPVTITATGAKATPTTTFTLTVKGDGACTGFPVVKTGTLIAGAAEYQPDGSWWHTGASGTYEACLDGPDSTDYDLYLRKWSGYSWSTVAQGTSPGPDETPSYTGTSGYYRYRIHAYSGAGPYTLGYHTP